MKLEIKWQWIENKFGYEKYAIIYWKIEYERNV